MPLAQRHAPVILLAALNKVQQLVSQHLCGDWVIRVEYAEQTPGASNNWRQWGKAMFALHNAEPVINGILTCQEHYPAQAIRLSAEKMRPQTRMIYWVHPPRLESSQHDTRQPPTETPASIANKLWRAETSKAQTMYDNR
ncbi:MAG: ribulose bisphosphate carboxylase small subunit [Gammaproteobacteria bacterium]